VFKEDRVDKRTKKTLAQVLSSMNWGIGTTTNLASLRLAL